MLLNLYSFFYAGLSLVTGTAFLYFQLRKQELSHTFSSLQLPLFCLFVWSSAWAICNSLLSQETAYIYVFVKNPVILLMGYAISKFAFEYQGIHFPKWNEVTKKLGSLGILGAILCNGWGFFHREIQFDAKMEFYVPVQSHPNLWIQLSIVSIASVLCLLLLNALFQLFAKLPNVEPKKRLKIWGFIVTILTIIFLAFGDIFVDLGVFQKPFYLFFLTNFTIIFATVFILILLNLASVPTSVGFKIMIFNLTMIYLVLSFVANFLFFRFTQDYQENMAREKDTIKSQLESGIKHPFVYQSDLVMDMQNEEFRIKKITDPLTTKDIFKTNQSIPSSFQFFKLISYWNDRDGIFWYSDFYANNHHFRIGIPYLDYRIKIHSTVNLLILIQLLSFVIIFGLYPLLHKTSIVLPLTRLLTAIRSMQKGNLDTKIETRSMDEIGEITSSFNEMIAIVRDARVDLEQKIQDRTISLNQTIQQLEETQEQLILAERMSTMGKVAANVAHEINNPLAAIKGSIHLIKDTLLEAPKVIPDEKLYHQMKVWWDQSQKMLKKKLPSRMRRKKELTLFFSHYPFSDPELLADTCFDLGVEELSEPYWNEAFQTSAGRECFLFLIQATIIQFHLRLIETAVERASKIVFTLKHYSYSGPKDKGETFSIQKGIESVLSMYVTIWKGNIEMDWEATADPKVFGYPEELVQVWTNLIYNAIQACPPTQGHIQIRLEEENQWAKVTIKDNGSGISPQNLEKIFEPFFTTKEIGLGTGLGLSIVKKIIEHHQGKIFVESQRGETVFTILLPTNGNK